MGLQVSNQVVSLEKELPVIRTANKLQIPQDQPVWRLERIRMADSVPIATEVNYIPAALVPNMEAQLAQNQSFYSCLEEEYGIVIVYGARARGVPPCQHAGEPSSRHSKGSAILYVRAPDLRLPQEQADGAVPRRVRQDVLQRREVYISPDHPQRINIVVCCGRSTHSTLREFQTHNIRR